MNRLWNPGYTSVGFIALLLAQACTPSWAASCEDPFIPIAEIQGRSDDSPSIGHQVRVQGVMTLDLRHPGGFEGFYIQQASSEQDGDDRTSEGLFVHTRSSAGTPGDRVAVQGEVREYYGLTSLTGVSGVSVCSQPGLPEPQPMMPGTIPPEHREALEGMLVTTTGPLTIVDTWNLGRYGEVVLAPGPQWVPTQVMQPGPGATAHQAQQESQRLILDDGMRRKYPRPVPWLNGSGAADPGVSLRVGDRIRPVEGVLDYRFGQWRLQPRSRPVINHTNPREMSPARHPGANLRVASLNLRNLFNGDGTGGGFPTDRGAATVKEYQQQLARLARQIRAMDPDILSVSELENDGYGEHSALSDLARALGNHWRFVEAGTQRHSDVIRNGLLYRSDRVRTLKPAVLIDDDALAQWHRPAIAQDFTPREGGEVVTVVAVHLKSKSCRNAPSPQQAASDGQGCFAAARSAAARQLAQWQPTGIDEEPLVLLAGDFNAYAMETPLQVLTGSGYRDLVARFHGREQQTFRYRGRQGTLDYHLANRALNSRVLTSQVWSVNAEEPRLWAYDARQPVPVPPGFLWRASDHNPVITDLRLSPSE